MSNIQKAKNEVFKIEDNISPKELAIKLHTGTKKMRTYSDKDFDKIRLEISGLALLLGLKEITPMEVGYTVDFLKAEAKDFSFTEFKHALTLNTSGKLEEHVKPFGSILNYVGAILREYRKYRSKHLARAEKVEERPSKEQIEASKINLYQDIFEELNKNYKNGTFIFSYIDSIKYFDTLNHFGLLPKYKEEKPETAKELWLQAEENLKTRYNGSLDRESRSIMGYLNDKSNGISDNIKEKLTATQTKIYKGLILTHFLKDCAEIIEDLNELKNE
jgi:hypothetical protein